MATIQPKPAKPASPLVQTAFEPAFGLTEIVNAINTLVDRVDRLEAAMASQPNIAAWERLAVIEADEADGGGVPTGAAIPAPVAAPAPRVHNQPVATPASTVVAKTANQLREDLTERYGRESGQVNRPGKADYDERSLAALLGYYAEDVDGSPLQDQDKAEPHFRASLKTPGARLGLLRAICLREFGRALWDCPQGIAFLLRDADRHTKPGESPVCRLTQLQRTPIAQADDVIREYLS